MAAVLSAAICQVFMAGHRASETIAEFPVPRLDLTRQKIVANLEKIAAENGICHGDAKEYGGKPPAIGFFAPRDNFGATLQAATATPGPPALTPKMESEELRVITRES